jgi:hypothetical protein
VPLNFFVFSGRKTTMRVLYPAVSAGVTVHLPSTPSGPTFAYAVAVPLMKNSSET